MEIDAEVKRIVDECYAEVEQLLTEKKELITALAERLLEKESINLPEIIEVIGARPFENSPAIKNYLSEMNERKEKEEAKAEAEKEAAAAVADTEEAESTET